MTDSRTSPLSRADISASAGDGQVTGLDDDS